VLAGKDLLGVAQTGTGKTAAFALPILQQLSSRPDRARAHEPHALVLAPTRELAIQIHDDFRDYGSRLRLRQAVIIGGVTQGRQVTAVSGRLDILVATPGRLLDLIDQGYVSLERVAHFVLDEADRMLDMGFIHDVKKVLRSLPRRRHSLFFSATMPPEVVRLAEQILTQPVRVEVTPSATTVDQVRQQVYLVQTEHKRDLLVTLLEQPALSRVLVFTRTKHRANRVAEYLERANIDADAIHGNKSQGARQRALDRFKSGSSRVLVATDIAARGIDVDGVTHVVNYEIPNEPESYVHRIGRTARAGAAGVALSLCDRAELTDLRNIERLIGLPLEVVPDQPFHAGTSGVASAGPSGVASAGTVKRRGLQGMREAQRAPGAASAGDRPPRRYRRRSGRRRAA
jgi:ATP-dependent RNA helicase RhlE